MGVGAKDHVDRHRQIDMGNEEFLDGKRSREEYSSTDLIPRVLTEHPHVLSGC